MLCRKSDGSKVTCGFMSTCCENNAGCCFNQWTLAWIIAVFAVGVLMLVLFYCFLRRPCAIVAEGRFIPRRRRAPSAPAASALWDQHTKKCLAKLRQQEGQACTCQPITSTAVMWADDGALPPLLTLHGFGPHQP